MSYNKTKSKRDSSDSLIFTLTEQYAKPNRGSMLLTHSQQIRLPPPSPTGTEIQSNDWIVLNCSKVSIAFYKNKRVIIKFVGQIFLWGIFCPLFWLLLIYKYVELKSLRREYLTSTNGG